jgi:hypothetical protein
MGIYPDEDSAVTGHRRRLLNPPVHAREGTQ